MFNLKDDEKKLLSHDFEDILISCTFNSQTCSVSDFVWKFDKFFGNCFVFNSGFDSSGNPVELKKSYVAGSLFGLSLQFYVGFHEHLTLFNSINFNGAYVRIENSSVTSDDLLDNGIYITPGKWANALIHRIQKYVLPKPFSVCELDNDSRVQKTNSFLLNLMYHSQYQYSQQTCIIQCLQHETIQNCNCTYPLYLSLFEHNSCLTEQQLNCYNEVWSKFLQKNYVQVILNHFMHF